MLVSVHKNVGTASGATDMSCSFKLPSAAITHSLNRLWLSLGPQTFIFQHHSNICYIADMAGMNFKLAGHTKGIQLTLSAKALVERREWRLPWFFTLPLG
jgi:hypothetical protein